MSGVGFELASNLSHVDAQVVALLRVLRTPNLLKEETLGDRFSRIADQELYDVPP